MSEYLESAKKYKGYHYSVLTPEMMQYLHDRTLEMLRIIIPIFEYSLYDLWRDAPWRCDYQSFYSMG